MSYDTTVRDLKEKYRDLKRNLIDLSITYEENQRHLEALKDTWGKHIGSVRQLEAAGSLETLIHLLEKRTALGWFKVELLDDVLLEYEIEGATRDDYMSYLGELDKYRIKNRKAFIKEPFDPDILREIPANSEAVPSEISELVCDGMGSEWRYFARELVELGFLVEGKSDELQRDDTKTNKEKTQILMDFFMEGDHRRTKLNQLSKLLLAINRTDLVEKVEEKFMELFNKRS